MDYVLKTQTHTVLADSLYRSILSGSTIFHYFMAGENGVTTGEASSSYRYELDSRNTMIATKKIGASDVSLVLPRLDWVTGKIWDKYDDNLESYPSYSGATSLSEAKFYVLTSNFNVYKCLDNNNNSVSTVEPFGTSYTRFSTSDGYIWKFMYSTVLSTRNKFLNSNFMPVQVAAQEPFYSFGKINSCSISNMGTGYTSASIAISGDGNGASITPVLQNGNVTSYSITNPGSGYTYVNLVISGNGFGATMVAELSTGDLSTNQSLVETSAVFGTIEHIAIISGGSGYTTASVSITGDGSGATATATLVSGIVTKINMTNVGLNYSKANIVISGNGTGANCRSIISPVGGHGKNAVNELRAQRLLFYSTITGERNQGFFTANSFVQVGIIRDVRTFADVVKFPRVNGSPLYAFTVSGGSTFNDDNLIDSVSGARYKVFYTDGTNILVQNMDNAIPVINIKLNNTTSSGQVTVTKITVPSIDKFSGELMYIGNVMAVKTSADQIVTLKTTIKF